MSKIPPTLIIDPPEELQVMQDEIFGPVMPIKSYDQVEDDFLCNDRPRPLGLYILVPTPKRNQMCSIALPREVLL